MTLPHPDGSYDRNALVGRPQLSSKSCVAKQQLGMQAWTRCPTLKVTLTRCSPQVTEELQRARRCQRYMKDASLPTPLPQASRPGPRSWRPGEVSGDPRAETKYDHHPTEWNKPLNPTNCEQPPTTSCHPVNLKPESLLPKLGLLHRSGV